MDVKKYIEQARDKGITPWIFMTQHYHGNLEELEIFTDEEIDELNCVALDEKNVIEIYQEKYRTFELSEEVKQALESMKKNYSYANFGLVVDWEIGINDYEEDRVVLQAIDSIDDKEDFLFNIYKFLVNCKSEK